jgi:hypothetical protein
MNRWRQRLDELHGETRPSPFNVRQIVQNVQNVQNQAPDPTFEHFEQFEQGAQSPPVVPQSWSETEDERAAIVEYDGNIPRTWAEGFARLDPKCPPGDVPAKRWQTFIDDIGRFLDGPFCAAATAFGWEPFDLFGCDRYRPFARIDCAGLLWSLHGDRLLALTENTATIETRTGTRQTWRRKPAEPARVLPWEIAL